MFLVVVTLLYVPMPMRLKITEEYSDERDGILLIVVPDCWAKSQSRNRGWLAGTSKCGEKHIEIIKENKNDI